MYRWYRVLTHSCTAPQVGQRHYYFMNIGNGEVIDACRKVGDGERGGGGIDPCRQGEGREVVGRRALSRQAVPLGTEHAPWLAFHHTPS